MEGSWLTTSSKRPKKIQLVGGSVVCLVEKVHFTTKIEKTNLSLFTIPKREDLRKKKFEVLKHVGRKGGAYSFDVKNPKQNNICVRVPFQGLRSSNYFRQREKESYTWESSFNMQRATVKQKATRPTPKN